MKCKMTAIFSAMVLLLTGCAVESETEPATRDNPEKEATAEEIREETGFQFFAPPEGAEYVTYLYDPESRRGSMGFILDGVTWTARVIQSDHFFYLDAPYEPTVSEYGAEISCDFDSGQVLQVHGAEPDLKYYRMDYTAESHAYMLYANWFLENEGYMISLTNYSEQRVHTMPVEIFG